MSRALGRVVSIDAIRGDTAEVTVDIDGEKHPAIVYTSLVGECGVGDEVLLNTTAVRKRLGTGGYHFVMANLSREVGDVQDQAEEEGHVVKARYTPFQHTVQVVSEESSPHRRVMEEFESLGGMPVVVGQLHSQLAPAAAAAKRMTQHRARVAYVMTDSAALPIGFSRTAAKLREAGILDATITSGQAFGGELEAVNIFTALIAAKQVVRADAVVVCPGPGNVGTGTLYGFSSIEMGAIVNAVNILGGSAIAVARISFADPRPRHQGISHHTITALCRTALSGCTIALPMIDQMKLLTIEEQIARTTIPCRHKTRVLDGKPGIVELQEKGIHLSSMGRSYEEDEEFFLSAAAAGALAAEMLRTAG